MLALAKVRVLIVHLQGLSVETMGQKAHIKSFETFRLKTVQSNTYLAISRGTKYIKTTFESCQSFEVKTEKNLTARS
jgi:hypothetical protein